LQVQSNHFEDFFSPELDKHGYQPLYKKRTTEVCLVLYCLL
jgi:CCR4-NOT transcription complex subunit 6